MEPQNLDSGLSSVPNLGDFEQITQRVWALVVSITKWNNSISIHISPPLNTVLAPIPISSLDFT